MCSPFARAIHQSNIYSPACCVVISTGVVRFPLGINAALDIYATYLLSHMLFDYKHDIIVPRSF
ncbi:hypothetical protein PILCRDRAFT_812908 [Piloderma croceum F 1598]|uniref:Uncharacterized protein n=1 Tax=Piloderma croceum (strain F 1598) TaxID=765440 RepID=A0A0C3GEG1_PILCF|nr:hypothetical protein PILCRDRAFT_812908 [Piloderma croceum F 1598]